jgi:predicted TPR repeat methyltransferase
MPAPNAHANGQALYRAGDLDGARAQFEASVASDPAHWASRHDLGFVLRQLGEQRGADLQIRRSLALAPGFALGWTTSGLLAGDAGAFDAARRAIDRARLIAPAEPTSLIARADLATDLECAKLARQLAAAAGHPGLDDRLRARLLHALGRILDRLDDTDGAFDAVTAAHGMRRLERPYDRAEDSAFFASIVDACGTSWWDGPANTQGGAERPIFIVGMPRSGTTLLEQMLSRHPDIRAGGESLALQTVIFVELAERVGRPFPDCLAAASAKDWGWVAQRYLALTAGRRRGAAVFTDKLPANFLLAGPILKAFPEARVIHMVRDPLDTCLSGYLTDFAHGHNFATDLGDLGHHFRLYRSLMRHWRSLVDGRLVEVEYEALAAAPEATLRGILERCGLEWHADCLAYDTAPHAVNTAAWRRVRAPLDPGRIGRWRRYGHLLGRLVAELAGPVAGPDEPHRRCLVWQPGDRHAVIELAAAAIDRSDTGPAGRRLAWLPAAAADHPPTLIRAATLAERAGRSALSLQLLAGAIRFAPGHSVPHANLAVARGRLGEVDAAVRGLRRSLALAPGFPEAWSNLGNFLAPAAIDAALAAHRRATTVAPADPGHYGNLGLALLRTAEGAPSAERALHRALVLAPADRAHGLSLYHLLSAMGRGPSALGVLDRLRCGHPLDSEVHYERGCALRDAERDSEAAAALRRAIVLSPEITAWRHVLDSLTGRPSRAAPIDYVRELFDQYADRFDHHLTERLRYRTPTVLADAVARARSDTRTFDRVLDLGCGTGLMGAALRDRFKLGHLTGVDISGAMLAKLKEKGGYDATAEADILDFLARDAGGYDLILAADVLVYFGALDRFLEGARRSLAPGGLLAISVEQGEAAPFELKRHGRYAHRQDYAEAQAHKAGLRPLLCEEAELRDEGREPVIGLLLVLAAEPTPATP